MKQDENESNYSACDLACWSTTTPACYRGVAWGSFCFMRSTQEIPTPDWVCMSVFQTCCYPTVCMSASRDTANKRGRGLHGVGTKQQRLPGMCMCVCCCHTIPLTSFCWETESENVCTCNSSSLYPLREQCVCMFIKRDHVSPPRSNRLLRLVHVPPTEGSNSSRADASALSGATIKNKQEVDGQGKEPMRAGFNSALTSTANNFLLLFI